MSGSLLLRDMMQKKRKAAEKRKSKEEWYFFGFWLVAERRAFSDKKLYKQARQCFKKARPYGTLSASLDRHGLNNLFLAKGAPALGFFFAGRLPFTGFGTGNRGFELAEKGALEGCSWSQLEYADYYIYGNCSPIRTEGTDRAKWIKSAAEAGNPKAQMSYAFEFSREDEAHIDQVVLAAAKRGWVPAFSLAASAAQKRGDWEEGYYWPLACQSNTAEL